MQENQNLQNTPFIQKVVPVKKNGFVLELQVPPPGYLPQATNVSQQQSQQVPPEMQPNLIAEQQSQINLNQVQIEEASQKPLGGIGQSLRDIFRGR